MFNGYFPGYPRMASFPTGSLPPTVPEEIFRESIFWQRYFYMSNALLSPNRKYQGTEDIP